MLARAKNLLTVYKKKSSNFIFLSSSMSTKTQIKKKRKLKIKTSQIKIITEKLNF